MTNPPYKIFKEKRRKRVNTTFSSSAKGNLALGWFSRSDPLNTPTVEMSTVLIDCVACGWQIACGLGVLTVNLKCLRRDTGLGDPWSAWLLKLRMSPARPPGATWMELLQERLPPKSGWLSHLLNVGLITLLLNCHWEVGARKCSPWGPTEKTPKALPCFLQGQPNANCDLY